MRRTFLVMAAVLLSGLPAVADALSPPRAATDTIPEVINLSLEEALVVLDGFSVTVEGATTGPRRVIAQDPPAGSPITDAVTIVVYNWT